MNELPPKSGRTPGPDMVPTQPNPLRQDAPGSITEMPSPSHMGHIHINTDVNYQAMVDFYIKLFNGEETAQNPGNPMTFITYDDFDHRIVVMYKEGWGTKPDRAVGYSHLAFCYQSLGEVLFIYKRMREWGYKPHWTINHGNSTSFYYKDPDGNEVETVVDNFPAIETKAYKMHYQFSEDFGPMKDGDFDPDKMVELFEAGMPDTILLDRNEVKRLIAEGKL
ncbi:MAG: VOC family protein [Rhodospirillales bacterium]|nr:VOC family protein [Rhodospirillales bacterium]